MSEIHATAPLTHPGSPVLDSQEPRQFTGKETDGHVHTFFDQDQYPAMHFEDAGQQKLAAALGMWAFLATEVLLFAGLFLVYTIYRNLNHEGFFLGSHMLDIPKGTANTMVLLLSSVCVVLAVNQAQKGNSRGIVRNLIFTMILGLVFFVIKGFEWHHDYEEGLVPWMQWDGDRLGDKNFQLRLFMVLYFVMTGTHAAHMIVGMVLLGVVAYKAHQNRFRPDYYTPLEMVGLYWHFVDIVWVFLIPTLYLIDLYAKTPGGGH
ncbi:MAG: heme/copper-type cytochrome/quinol oxidase, subunit 3 [Phycisphaerales bacterium]|nr:heme/copper-type cytochrome/quinol oxidase, subunit 3 [Phycisphaerales bacterium]